MTKPPHVPVVITGAVPTGVTAGIMLAQRGIARLLLERQPQVYALPRAGHYPGGAWSGSATGIPAPAPSTVIPGHYRRQQQTGISVRVRT
jgi:thioredoxin reductase